MNQVNLVTGPVDASSESMLPKLTRKQSIDDELNSSHKGMYYFH